MVLYGVLAVEEPRQGNKSVLFILSGSKSLT